MKILKRLLYVLIIIVWLVLAFAYFVCLGWLIDWILTGKCQTLWKVLDWIDIKV